MTGNAAIKLQFLVSMNSSSDILFQPIKLGEIELQNRIVMASMSRARTENPELVPIPMQADYYRQRASAGLIMTEGTWPSAEAIGAIHVHGLFNEKQAEGWKHVTDAVHDAGGRIFVQLGHLGAASHPDLLGGALPLAPSSVGLEQQVITPTGFQTSPTPKAMTLGDIARSATTRVGQGLPAKQDSTESSCTELQPIRFRNFCTTASTCVKIATAAVSRTGLGLRSMFSKQ